MAFSCLDSIHFGIGAWQPVPSAQHNERKEAAQKHTRGQKVEKNARVRRSCLVFVLLKEAHMELQASKHIVYV